MTNPLFRGGVQETFCPPVKRPDKNPSALESFTSKYSEQTAQERGKQLRNAFVIKDINLVQVGAFYTAKVAHKAGKKCFCTALNNSRPIYITDVDDTYVTLFADGACSCSLLVWVE